LAERAAPWIDAVVAGARTLPERLAAARELGPCLHELELRRLWCDRVADGDATLFARRLAWEGLEPRNAPAVLALEPEGEVPGGPGGSSSPHPPRSPLQPWAELLGEIGREAGGSPPLAEAPRQPAPGAGGRPPIPFADLFAPHLAVARRRLRTLLAARGIPERLLADAAWSDLGAALAERLSQLSAAALLRLFDRHRGRRSGAFSAFLAEIGGAPDDHLYRGFVARQWSDGLAGLYASFPFLGRLTGCAVESWIESSCELLTRFVEDGPAIAERLLPTSPLGAALASRGGAIQRIDGPLSDLHHGGRAVYAIELDSGLELIYKPRSLGAAAAFHDLLAWCNSLGPSLTLAAHRVLDRGSHGWTELVAAAPCEDEQAVRRFYHRAGMLLCLLHALGSSDCHCENLVASGEHPQLIDFDALLPLSVARWLTRPDSLGDGWQQASAVLGRSVLATGMLPLWRPGGQAGELFDAGGLGGGLPRRRRAAVWRAINSDAMAQGWQETEVGRQPNLPVLDGAPRLPGAHVDEIIAGFSEIYSLLLRHRAVLLAPSGPLHRFAAQQTRLIFRPTAAYALLLEKLLEPELLGDSEAWCIELDTLSRPFLQALERPPTWPLLAAEQHDLARGDVPLWVVAAVDTDLVLPDGDRIADFFARSSLAVLRDRLAALSPEDLRFQVVLLRAAFAMDPGPTAIGLPDRVAPPAASAVAGADAVAGAPEEAAAWAGPLPRGVAGPSREALLGAAVAIARRLEGRAIRGDDGSMAWIGLEFVEQGRHHQLAVTGPDLYAGTAGIALFFAGLALVLPQGGWRETAMAALAAPRREVAWRVERPPGAGGPPPSIGGALVGLASWLYALVQAGRLLGRPELVAEAHRATVLFTPAAVAGDAQLDVVGGSAGAILALLALDRETGEEPNGAGETPIAIALRCADRLLAARQPPAPRGWPSGAGSRPLGGFSHGAAGICHALLQLYARCGRRQLLEAALEGRELERTLFSPERGNWRDLRDPEGGFSAAWCHGAPGIALSRLANLAVLDGPAVRAEIAAALAVTRAVALTPVDHLCCGNLGRADVLLFASDCLADRALREAACDLAGEVLARAAADGGYRLLPGRRPVGFDPSLFRGLAGVGYALMRLASPGAPLPCVLALG
jgi:type 2 lantibiotic biosynthesis protein LanM